MPAPWERPGALRRRLDRVPLRWRRVVLLGVVTGFLGAGYLGVVLLHWLVDDDPVDWTAPLPGLLGGFIGTAGVVCLQRRSLGATLTRGQPDRALRDGRLPEDADAELWALVLGDELADLRASLTAGLATMVVLAGSATGPALVVDPARAGMSLTAVVLAVGGLLCWMGRRRERRIRRLLEQVATEVPPAG